MFFVLSGYLITGILVAEYEQRHAIDRRAFYLRRALRLVPALSATVAGVLVVSAVVGHAGVTTRQLAWASAASLLYFNDIVLAAGARFSYWLDMTWSLGVEEQFYILWPFVLLTAIRRAPRVTIGRWCVGLAVVAAILTGALRPALGNDITYYSPVGSLAPLLLGCGIALWRPQLPDRWLQPFWALLLAAGVLLAYFVHHGPLPYGASAWRGPEQLAVGATGLAIVWLDQGQVVGLLRAAPIVWLGQRSYGIYLFHTPIRAALQNGLPAASESVVAAVGLLVTIGAAALSYRYLEEPFLRLKRRYDRVGGAAGPDAAHVTS